MTLYSAQLVMMSVIPTVTTLDSGTTLVNPLKGTVCDISQFELHATV